MTTSTGNWYKPGDGQGSLVITFVGATGGPVNDSADVFLKHFWITVKLRECDEHQGKRGVGVASRRAGW